MFDIDDTLLNTKNFKPIKPIVNLVKLCNELKITVLIITARDSRYTQETAQDLAELNMYPRLHKKDFIFPEDALFYDYLYLRHSPRDDHDYFKSHVKQRLFELENVRTIMSVGDNVIDIVGDYSGYALKLPNHNDPRLYHKDYYGNIIQVN
jgi:predicted secreted acid phosphatase